jgi:hypothetical protein
LTGIPSNHRLFNQDLSILFAIRMSILPNRNTLLVYSSLNRFVSPMEVLLTGQSGRVFSQLVQIRLDSALHCSVLHCLGLYCLGIQANHQIELADRTTKNWAISHWAVVFVSIASGLNPGLLGVSPPRSPRVTLNPFLFKFILILMARLVSLNQPRQNSI